MAEAAKKTDPAPKAAPPAPTLARASEATDPAVHHILAELQTAQMNDDGDAMAALTKKLNELGYE